MLLSLSGRDNPERISHVSHSIRELTSILPSYITDISLPRQIDVVGRLKNLGGEWESFHKWFHEENGSIPSTHIQEIVGELNAIFNLLGNMDSQRELLLEAFARHPTRGNLPSNIREAIVKEWIELNRWFLREAHHYRIRNRLDNGLDEREFEQQVLKFEDLVYRILILEPFFEPVAAIDQLLAIEYPTERDSDTLIRSMSDLEHHRYFFDKCNNPNWLPLLIKRNFFTKPMPLIREGDQVSFPFWPESRFLARIADQKPREIMQIIMECPDTDNPNIHEDFADVALKVPVTQAAQLVGLVEKYRWLETPYHTLLPSRIGDLMQKLAAADKVTDALRLANLLCDVHGTQPIRLKEKIGPISTIRPNAKSVHDDWELLQIVEKKSNDLVVKAPTEFLNILCKRLAKAMKIEDIAGKYCGDFSVTWRPYIDRALYGSGDVKDALIKGIINQIKITGGSQPDKLPDLLNVLKAHKYSFFRRVELHLYYLYPDYFSNEIKDLLIDHRLMRTSYLRREYVPLLEDQFPKLDETVQSKVLNNIECGPRMTKTEEQTEEDIRSQKERWQLRFLTPIEDYLPDDWKQKYQKMIRRHGKLTMVEEEVSGWIGPTSPLTAEEISDMKAEEVLDYVAKWPPPRQEFRTPSPEGLGRLLEQTVQERSLEFSRFAEILSEKRAMPVYISHFLSGLSHALENDKPIEWLPIVKLGEAIISADNISKFPKPSIDSEIGWKGAHKSIVSLFGVGFVSSKYSVPWESRKTVWKIIEAVTNDDDPTVEYEQDYVGENMDPFTLSINTVRGEAMHTVIKYAFWCSQNLDTEGAKTGESRMVPEVKSVLNRHLDLAVDASLAIRSVYGRYAPNLVYLDREWVQKNVAKIFPKESSQKAHWIAAWGAYLRNRVYDTTFEVLKDEYRRAFSLLTDEPLKGPRVIDIDRRMPHHLMTAYAYGLADEDLIEAFFNEASVHVRAEAIHFIGRGILQKRIPDSPQALKLQMKRFRELWDKRLDVENPSVEELREFGWWFARIPFDKEWTINSLLNTLKATKGDIQQPDEIIEELKEYSGDFPMLTISALNSIAQADERGWGIHIKIDDYCHIIQEVIKSSSEEAKKIAAELIDFLGRRGFTDLKDLSSEL